MQKKIACGAWLKASADGQTIHWIPNPGNAGDSLITAATELILRQEGLDFQSVSDPMNFDSRGKFVAYGGGGNLVRYYKKARRFLQRHHESAKRLVILPHTVEGNEDLLAAFSSRVTIICRELVSYAHCRVAAPKAEVLVADDLALSSRPEDLLSLQIIPSKLTELITYFALSHSFVRFAKEYRGQSQLTVWRGGPERHSLRPYPAMNDISRMFQLKGIGIRKGRTLKQMKISAQFFLRGIDLFSSIRTDRLHVAIGAALLGKDVELYSNDSYKNRAVYDFSLSSLPNVRFVHWIGPQPGSDGNTHTHPLAPNTEARGGIDGDGCTEPN